MEAKTYRYLEHAAQLPVVSYRTSEEIEQWKRERDPIQNFRQRLLDGGVFNGEAVKVMESAVQAEIEEAVRFARQSPEPDAEEAFDDLYANPIPMRRSVKRWSR